MKADSKIVLLATAALVAIWGGAPAVAQGWGPAVAAKDIDPVIRAAAEVMGMVRTRALVIGQVNLPEFSGKGTMVDIEAASRGPAVEISRYNYAVALHVPAARLDYEGPNTARTIRVVKGDRAWNEVWSDDKKTLRTTPSDKGADRAQMMWVQPHAFLHAAAFASGKKCLDGKACTTPVKIAQENGRTTIELQINGHAYKATLGADKRPEHIETVLSGSRKLVASYIDYRTGEAPDGGFGTSYGQGALDRYHSGTYWPSRLTHEVGGMKVLDLIVTEGWANPYMVFPDPELLAKGQ